MSMEYLYAKEKLAAAILILVKGHGGIKERLFDVGDQSGFSAITAGDPDALPPELLNRYSKLNDRLNPKTIEEMSEDDAAECAEEILNLYLDVSSV